MSDLLANALIESTIRAVAVQTEGLDAIQFARLVGRLMSHMTFSQATVNEMVRALGPLDFSDFCEKVPTACKTRAVVDNAPTSN